MIYIASYESSKKYLDKQYPSMSPTINALFRSILAGATAVTFCNPIWVIKTRIQLQNNVEHELISIYHKIVLFLTTGFFQSCI